MKATVYYELDTDNDGPALNPTELFGAVRMLAAQGSEAANKALKMGPLGLRKNEFKESDDPIGVNGAFSLRKIANGPFTYDDVRNVEAWVDQLTSANKDNCETLETQVRNKIEQDMLTIVRDSVRINLKICEEWFKAFYDARHKTRLMD